MSKLRKTARNRPCQVRIPGVCDGGGETTILAHYSLHGLSGRGMKSPDAIGAWCCAPCHRAVDGQTNSEYPRDLLRLWLAEGVFRTQNVLMQEGLM